MKKSNEHLFTVLIVSIALISVFEFSFRGYPILRKSNGLSSDKNNTVGNKGIKKEDGPEGLNMLPKSVQNELFPVTGSLFYPENQFTGSVDTVTPYFMGINSSEMAFPINLNIYEEKGVNLFITNVKIE